MNFDNLIQAIADIHQRTQTGATKAVNVAMTLRNWLIGAHIHEYELRGQDRAEYGELLIPKLADALLANKVPSCANARLYAYVTFYRSYPQIQETLPPEAVPSSRNEVFTSILRSLTGELTQELMNTQIVLTSGQLGKRESDNIFRSLTGELQFPAKSLLMRLSYSHFEQLSTIDDPLKRAFYEIECIKGNWSVRELKRQIGSLYFERSGLSRDKEQLSRLANEQALQAQPRHVIRDPYVFEFLGLRPSEVLPESDLEAALLEKMQSFLLELGHGFCFEARQKRLTIGGEHYFVDLVFYHRVLKCHVLVDLKVGAFTHEQLGQLNTYVSYYRANEMTAGDQPPVGILLCTDKNQALVEYALAGMDNQLFVAKYQVELPRPEVLQRYLSEQRKILEGNPA